jgi:hypothetical protein
VHALDRALRDAISETYPHLRDIKLVNYKVRILDEHEATAAVTRVLLDASDGTETWGTIGVHENVIAGRPWHALVDSIEHPMQPGKEQHAARHPAPRVSASETDVVPLAQPSLASARRSSCSSHPLGQRSLGPMGPRFERAFAERIGAPLRQRRLERDRGAAPRACAPSASRTATRSSPRRSRSWPAPT